MANGARRKLCCRSLHAGLTGDGRLLGRVSEGWCGPLTLEAWLLWLWLLLLLCMSLQLGLELLLWLLLLMLLLLLLLL